MDDFFERPQRKPVRDLNLVPVIDMFTTVLFFLLLSTSFYGFTKLTVPPSKVSVNTDPLVPPPLSARLLVAPGPEGNLSVVMSWVGAEPGKLEATATQETLEPKVKGLVEQFSQKHPMERTVQLGLAPGVNYQALIWAMDGARQKLPDIVLISPEDALARLGSGGG